MFNLAKKTLLLTLLASASLIASADNSSKLAEAKSRVVEVYVLSLQFAAQGSASLVANPCDSYETCDNILARINANTNWQNDGDPISYQQAKKLKWDFALLKLDKNNNALVVNRYSEEEEG